MLFNLDSATIIARIIVLVVAFTIHEFAHAWSATRFGDDTPRLNGRLSLNPMVHLDPLGSLMLLLAGFGWAKPVPVNPYAVTRRHSSGFMWVAAAGPISNLFLAVFAAVIIRIGMVNLFGGYPNSQGFLPSFPQIMLEFIYINLVLMVFNLIPLSPLDGEKVLSYLAPSGLSGFMDAIRPYGPMLLMVIIFVGPMIGFDLIGRILGPTVGTLLNVLLGI